jgi:ribonuclease D
LGRHQLILHGSDYDLRMLHKSAGFTPTVIFDTMIAARLCGVLEFGLASLLSKYLNLKLEKGSQKADWARRPLTPRMEEYARNDTRYLKPLSELLRAELETKGRLGWFQESCARLIEVTVNARAEESSRERWRLAGSNKLNRRGLAILREIWQWREENAVAANRPPFFVLSHDLAIGLADAASRGQPVATMIPPRMSPRRRDTLLEALNRGDETPVERQPEPFRPDRRRVSESEKKRFEELKSKRDKVAAGQAIDPTLIASKLDLLQLSRDAGPPPGLLMEWQRKLLYD